MGREVVHVDYDLEGTRTGTIIPAHKVAELAWPLVDEAVADRAHVRLKLVRRRVNFLDKHNTPGLSYFDDVSI